MNEPQELVVLDENKVRGIHYQGGTILESTNKGGPLAWPVKNKDGSWTTIDRSDELIRKLQLLGVEAVINIGGDGSQRISYALQQKGLNVIGVPKTIDNDVSNTDSTFGFQTAIQVATEAVDKLVTTAASHNRVIILEVMGRDAGWIALNAAVAGGAEVCLIPEIPYDIQKVVNKIESRFVKDRGFVNIVISEGARPKGGSQSGVKSDEVGYAHMKLTGAAARLREELKAAGLKHDIRETVLGHLQRGGVPIAYDRVLATQFGVRAFELILEEKFGQMVSYRHPYITSVPLKSAISKPNLVTLDTALIKTARGIGINFGD